MEWKKRLFANIFWRNVLASFGERSGYSKKPGGCVPYFQYQIGPLCFITSSASFSRIRTILSLKEMQH